MGGWGEQGKATPGTNSELLCSDKAIVNQAAGQTIREGEGGGGGGRQGSNQSHYDGPGDNNLLSSKQSGPAKLLHSLRESKTVGEKGFLSGGKRLIFNYETRLPRADTLSHTSSLLQIHHRSPERHDAPLMRGVNFPMHGFFGDTAEPSPSSKACLTLGQ